MVEVRTKTRKRRKEKRLSWKNASMWTGTRRKSFQRVMR
jgi:hypothetical protein